MKFKVHEMTALKSFTMIFTARLTFIETKGITFISLNNIAQILASMHSLSVSLTNLYIKRYSVNVSVGQSVSLSPYTALWLWWKC